MARRKNCPECGSGNQYFRPNVDVSSGYGPNLLPGTAGLFRSPKMHVVVCKDCGFMRFFAMEGTLEHIDERSGWEKL
jgi:hypothetical protein